MASSFRYIIKSTHTHTHIKKIEEKKEIEEKRKGKKEEDLN